MRILVVGAGAVGGYFGAKLALAGHEVTFLARGAHAAAIREHGLVVETPHGKLVGRGPVIEHIDQARGLGADLALVAVKASGLGAVAAGTGAALGEHGVAVPLLNGLDSEDELGNVIGLERVVGGVAMMAAGHVAPGRLYLRAGGMMSIAPMVHAQEKLVDRLAAELGKAFPCNVDKNLAHMLWQKLLWNAPFNAICALTRLPAGEVLALSELEELATRAMHEVVEVARAEDVLLGESSIDAMLNVTRGLFQDTEPSMLQDVRAGRPTEADALQGAVVRRGRTHGIPTPVHQALLALLHGLQQSYTEPPASSREGA
jgi:2-dehydropantoate 2-reductase